MQTKTCCTCSQSKPAEQFSKKTGSKDGLAANCKPCAKEYNEQWRAANDNRVLQNRQRYYEDNKEQILAANSQWRKDNAELQRSYEDAYKERNADRERLRKSQWKKENPEYLRAEWAKRRARKREAGGTFTAEDVKQLLNLQRGRCACCSAKLIAYHVDHVVPLARGGTNDKMNLQILCPPCNLSKNAKDPISFMQSRGFLL